MDKIKYICVYDESSFSNEKRSVVLAATNKLDYIFDILNNLRIHIDIISPIWTYEKKLKIYKRRYSKINEYRTLLLPFTFGCKSFILKAVKYIYTKLWQVFTLFSKIKKNDIVFVYHSLYYVRTLCFLKKLKKFKLIIEIEEIYAHVQHNKYEKLERKLFSLADGFIFPTDLLNKNININQKPYLIIHGTYRIEKDRKIKFNDSRIHCIYAGTFDRIKGGAFAAVAAAEFLPENYHVHIIGFGKEKEKQDLLELIQKVQLKTKCTITYDGCLSGEEYIRFIQSCDIGLCTQNPDAKFNETSFPSKVLSYMANGLRVVSIRIKALELSAVNDLLFYYDDQTPQAIAQAIQKIDLSQPYDSRERIRRLDEKFQQDLNTLLRDIKG